MAGILRKRRGFRGKDRKGHLRETLNLVEEVKRKQTERAVRKRSGKVGRFWG